ncbi:MAG: alpha/beta hydrolase family protein [Kofleriaceae bacterium]
MIPRWLVCMAFGWLVACGGDDPAPDRSVEQPGAHEVGTQRIVLSDAARGRSLTVQAWYPTDQPAVDQPIASLEVEPVRTRYENLLAAAPAACPRRTTHVAADAPAQPGPFPVIAFSHCHNCTRLASAATSERLASHGFVVLAVDHERNTLWDHLDGTAVDLDSAFLEVRAADIRFVLDQLPSLPFAASADLERVGVFGHSFGAVTAGRVAQLDDRVDAAAALCAPVENPLIAGVALAEIEQPLLFVVAVEDNSITEFGNQLARNNFRDAPGPAWKIEVADAGHWSVSDLVGIDPSVAAGCGDGERQTDGAPFTYLDPALGRDITAAYVTAFFRATLLDDIGARAYLSQRFPESIISVDNHE